MVDQSTWMYYETHAQEYFQATYTTQLGRLWDTLTRNLSQHASILDIGCGSGRDVRFFGEHGFNAIGIDYSFSLLKLASNFADRPMARGDVSYLPFKKHAFEAVWAVGSLLHIPRNSITGVLSQIRSVLKSEGYLFTAIKKGKGDVVDEHGRYNVFYDLREWNSILIDSGYSVLDIQEQVERRVSGNNTVRYIEWIECLAISSALDY